MEEFIAFLGGVFSLFMIHYAPPLAKLALEEIPKMAFFKRRSLFWRLVAKTFLKETVRIFQVEAERRKSALGRLTQTDKESLRENASHAARSRIMANAPVIYTHIGSKAIDEFIDQNIDVVVEEVKEESAKVKADKAKHDRKQLKRGKP